MNRFQLPELGQDPMSEFPSGGTALADPNGLLAWGGGLEPQRLVRAYSQGIFPWFSAGEPPLWWSPDPRMVVATDRLHLGRRFRRELRGRLWQASADRAFERVIDYCAGLPRPGQRGTWIVPSMRRAYLRLHELGHAHSIEAWEGDEIVGGLYGISIGLAFFGESMFSLRPGASKFVIAALCQRLRAWDMPMLDGQVESEHLVSLGFRPIPRAEFLARLAVLTMAPVPPGSWSTRFGTVTAAQIAAATGSIDKS